MRWRIDTHFMEALYVVFLAFCLVLLASCAHDPGLDKKIAEKTANLPAMGAQARTEAAEKQIDDASLPADKKAKLEQLTLSASTDLQALRDQSSRLRLLLVREIMDPTSDDREIDAIRKRILETDQLSSKRWISALEDARLLLGRKSERDRPYYRAFMLNPSEDAPGLGRDEGIRQH